MRAVVCRGYGPPEVMELKERPKTTPKNNEVLIKVRASTVTSADWRVRSMTVPAGFGPFARLALGILSPRQPILGTELAGDIEAVGEDVRLFKVGDPVFAFSGAKMGSYVEYKCIPEDGLLAHKPAQLSYEEAAALSFGGTTALDFFRRGKIQKGDQVLINGSAGGVGSAAVQLARHFGAEVTAVCGSGNIDFVKGLGADHVIDYTREDFAKAGKTYDIIMDTAGTAPYARSKDALKPQGRLLLVLGSFWDLLQAPWLSMAGKKQVIAGPVSERPEDLRFLADLAEKGEFRPAIDRRYPLEKIVEAHHYGDAGHKRGNLIIQIA